MILHHPGTGYELWILHHASLFALHTDLTFGSLQLFLRNSCKGSGQPLSSKLGTCQPVKSRFWPWLLGKSPHNLSRCSLVSRKRRSWGGHSS